MLSLFKLGPVLGLDLLTLASASTSRFWPQLRLQAFGLV